MTTTNVFHQEGQGLCLLVESQLARGWTTQALLTNLETIPLIEWNSFYRGFLVNGSGEIKGPYFHMLTMEGKTFIVTGQNPLVSSISTHEGKVSLQTIRGCKSVLTVDNGLIQKAMAELSSILRLVR